jgi:hypothetical protein
MSIRVAAVNADGVQVPHPQYGTAVQMNAAGNGGTPAELGQQRPRRQVRDPYREAGRRHQRRTAQAGAGL